MNGVCLLVLLVGEGGSLGPVLSLLAEEKTVSLLTDGEVL